MRTSTPSCGAFSPADHVVLTGEGYGAVQLAEPGAWGPPAHSDAAVAVLRAAEDLGVSHVDTADFYGSHVTKEVLREALAPYPDGLAATSGAMPRVSAT